MPGNKGGIALMHLPGDGRSILRGRAIRWWVCCLLLMLFVSGCIGGGHRSTPLEKGNVRGVVVNPNGDGIGGVYVSISGTTFATLTDEDGVYAFERVPVGRYDIITAYPAPGTQSGSLLTLEALPGNDVSRSFTLDVNETINESKTFAVTVRGGHDNVVESLTVPIYHAVDNFFLYHLDPGIRTGLTAGQRQDFYIDIHYALNTTNEGFIVILAAWRDRDGVESPQMEVVHPILKGVGSAPVGLTLGVPARTYIALYAALMDSQGSVLSMKSIGEYTISAGSGQIAPYLELVDTDHHRAHFAVHDGEVDNFDRYELYNARGMGSCHSPRVPSIYRSDDPHLESIVVDVLTEGEEQLYLLCMYPRGRLPIESNLARVTVPRYGVDLLKFSPGVSALAADPNRELLYAARRSSNKINVISTRPGDMWTDHVIDVIEVGADPEKMIVGDDGLMYVLHRGGSGVGVVDLEQRELVRWIPSIPKAMDITVDTNKGRLYATIPGAEPVKSIVRVIDLNDLSVLWEYTADHTVRRLALLADGEFLWFLDNQIIFVDTEDFTVVSNPSPPSLGSSQHYEVDGLVYSGSRVFDASTYDLVGEVNGDVFAVDSQGSGFYMFGAFTYDEPWNRTYAAIYEMIPDTVNGHWHPIVRVPLLETMPIGAQGVLSPQGVLSSDERFLYVLTGDHFIIKIDLDARRRGSLP